MVKLQIMKDHLFNICKNVIVAKWDNKLLNFFILENIKLILSLTQPSELLD